MNRIDCISELDQNCTGCMACVDACPVKCICSITKKDGFKFPSIDGSKCISCGKCYSVCPVEVQAKHKEEQHLFAAYSTDPFIKNRGSSGGVFELLARYFLGQGYYICGAAFEGTTLKHRVISSVETLTPLLKSKYVQSDMEKIYNDVLELLKKGEKVFYCGTPCQVSALINCIPKPLKTNLFTADIICHGVPSQKVFDEYIKMLEQKHGGKISDFSFRIKDNKYKHAHGYSYRVTKNGKVTIINGIYTESSFYNAFKNYLFFRESCYNCQYATLQRVSDITLADFWGIEKYDFNGSTDTGVSMIITNTRNGREVFSAVQENVVRKEFPIQCGIDSNCCLTHSTQKPKNRDAIIKALSEKGYKQVAKKYFRHGSFSVIQKFYWLLPSKVRSFIRRCRGR